MNAIRQARLHLIEKELERLELIKGVYESGWRAGNVHARIEYKSASDRQWSLIQEMELLKDDSD